MRIVGNPPSGGKKPTTPTIGTATDGGTGTTVSVAFTPSTYIGKDTITYTATSSPGSITGTGSGSPITVSGLTTGTAYTFTVLGNTNYGVASDSSAASNSVTPASPSSFESIATFTPTSGTSVSFTSIPSTYKSLQLRMININDGGSVRMTINSDTGANYTRHNLTGDGTTVYASGGTGNTYIAVDAGWYGATLVYPEVTIIDIIDYASTSKYKTIRGFDGNNRNSALTSVNLYSNLWLSTSAINTLTITCVAATFASGTSIALYGVK